MRTMVLFLFSEITLSFNFLSDHQIRLLVCLYSESVCIPRVELRPEDRLCSTMFAFTAATRGYSKMVPENVLHRLLFLQFMNIFFYLRVV
jgi:hypothetical protein